MRGPPRLRFLSEDRGTTGWPPQGAKEQVTPVPSLRKRFGQHFLEGAWADKVVAAIAPAASDVFLEIGPGAGALTMRLAPLVAHLTAVEIDRDLVTLLQPRLPPNVTLVNGDFLDEKGTDVVLRSLFGKRP